MENLVEQAVWDAGYEGFTFRVPDDALTDIISQKLEQLGPPPQQGTCFEMGCYPCQYLGYFGLRYGLQVNGVDAYGGSFAPVLDWLDSLGVQRGQILQQDAFAAVKELQAAGVQYDLVYSLGFIEHFTDHLAVIDAHDLLVAPGGLLILSTPNFRGWCQHLLHRWLDRENLARHAVASMDPDAWAARLRDRYDILYTGYVGGFDFWCEREKRGWLRQKALNAVLHTQPLWPRIHKDSPAWSPYCLLIARKKPEPAPSQAPNP